VAEFKRLVLVPRKHPGAGPAPVTSPDGAVAASVE
jgi:hypothetical protein